MYDVIVVGAGPAGITAVVYAARKRMSVLVLTEDIGGQAAWSGDIENYTGYQFISGPELAAKFEEHMRQYTVELREKEPVTAIQKTGDFVSVATDRGRYEAKSVIIASGKKSRKLGVEGEETFRNRGLTYCATCDGPLFSDKEVAVIGGGNSALDAVLQLMQIARKIYVITTAPQLSGDAVMQEKVVSNEKVVLYNSAQVLAISGDKMVQGITVRRGKAVEELPVQGVFVEIGLVPNSEFAVGVEKNTLGEIKVNCHNETNVPGIFAAGDVTDVPEKQIVIAAGEGAKAALSAFRYLAQQRF